MVARKKYKSLESPSGAGEVWIGDDRIAKVTYSLNIEQEVLITEAFDGTEEIDGQKSVSGSIVVTEGETYLLGKENLILILQDGRRIRFFIKQGLSGEFVIQPSGDFY